MERSLPSDAEAVVMIAAIRSGLQDWAAADPDACERWLGAPLPAWQDESAIHWLLTR